MTPPAMVWGPDTSARSLATPFANTPRAQSLLVTLSPAFMDSRVTFEERECVIAEPEVNLKIQKKRL